LSFWGLSFFFFFFRTLENFCSSFNGMLNACFLLLYCYSLVGLHPCRFPAAMAPPLLLFSHFPFFSLVYASKGPDVFRALLSLKELDLSHVCISLGVNRDRFRAILFSCAFPFATRSVYPWRFEDLIFLAFRSCESWSLTSAGSLFSTFLSFS